MRLHSRSILAFLVLGPALWAAEAQAADWPVQSTTTAHRVFAGYGQFAEDTGGTIGGFHFHEGADIEAAGGAPVFAVEDGTVVEVNVPAGQPAYDHFLTITRGAISSQALGYVHLSAGNNPRTGNPWLCGDTVQKGDRLGTVATTAGVYNHIHLEMDSDADGFTNCTGATSVAALAGDPMEIFAPTTDATKPTIEDVLFRDGGQEGVGAATYRTDIVAGRNVIFGNVDAIVKAHDGFGAFNSRLGIHKVGFEVLSGPRVISAQTLEHFTGTFITPPGSFGQFRNSDLAQVEVLPVLRTVLGLI